MNNFEIRERIDDNNVRIRELMTPSDFVLNNDVAKLLEENKQLQNKCTHEFYKGVCIYCDKKEAQNDSIQ
jgi:hypothetical protein